MDSIHKLLNILLPLLSFTILLLFLPPFLIYKLFTSIKKFKRVEDVAGKVVLITGASSGIGEHLAYEYAKRGARLALAARRVDRLKAVADKALRLGSPDAIVIPADVSVVDDCRKLVDETVNHFGQLDYLVNNAGVSLVSLFEDSTQISTIRSVMDINFWGSVYCTQFALPHLRKSKGKIIVLSSCSTWFSPPKLSFYNASKTAQLSFFETLKAEFGSEIGITIATPGIIKSEMTTRQVRSQYGVSQVPILSAEVCAKGIVESACRGEMYSTEPSWYKVGFWFKVLCPQLMFKCLHLSFIHSSRRTSEKDA
ncbi:hypothetical protein UlMin_007639 [Ulmus minor]